MSYRVRNISLALGLGILAAVLVTVYAKNSGTSSTIGNALTSVFVASGDIPAGTPGSELGGKIHRQAVPQAQVVPGAIRNPAEVRSLVATQRIYSGEQVTARSFQPLVAEGVRGQITGPERVMQLPGDPNQLLVGTLKVGDHIDVIANLKYKLANFRGTPVSAQQAQQDLEGARVVLRDLLVLQAPASVAGSTKFGSNTQYQVLLQLTDTQAQKLFFVTQNGNWTLQLRPAHGASDSPDSVDTTGSVLGDGLKSLQFGQLVYGPTVPK